MNQTLLTAAEAANYLRVSRATVRRLTVSGDIPAIKIGSMHRYRQEDLEQLGRTQNAA